MRVSTHGPFPPVFGAPAPEAGGLILAMAIAVAIALWPIGNRIDKLLSFV